MKPLRSAPPQTRAKLWLQALWASGTTLLSSHAAPPAQEVASFQLADPALTIELVAAEPDVLSPVALAWDSAGRLFVAEMRDYPNASTGGAIRRLEDRDGDGRFETSQIFAEGLPFPNSVLPWNGGLLVTAAPDLWFLKDTNGDGQAEERRVLFTGFGTGNQQLRANGLFWGLDGWVYGANGRSDGEIRRPESTERWSLRGRDFRFRPATGEFETLVGRSQFGHGRDAWGNRFLSWNTIPVRHEVFPDRHLAQHPTLAALEVVVDCLPAGDSGQIFPLTPPPLVFNNESGQHFNALSGLHVYRGEALGANYRGNAFVGESLRNLVHRRVLVAEGPTFRAERAETNREFLASTDPWFHPVNFATGPDDALYVADFYRQFVEHPDWVAKDTRDRVAWRTGDEHGRLWRIRRRSVPLRPFSRDLARLSTRELVRELEAPNSWRRETAQRLLFERGDTSAQDALRQLVGSSRAAESRVLALPLIDSTQAKGRVTLTRALDDPRPEVRAQAVAQSSAVPELAVRLADRPVDGDERVRLQTALALGAAHDLPTRESALRRIALATSNRWTRLAAAAGMGTTNEPWFSAVFPTPPPSRPVPTPRGADPDRQRVIEEFKPALQLTGERRHGAALLGRLCLSCHYLQGHGQRVGPDFGALASRPPETLLMDVLDPSRQVTPDFTTYELTLENGETTTGLIASESATRLTVRHAGAPDESIARSQIRQIRPTGRSLMPEGLEQGLSAQDLADLLRFLREPDVSLLPAP